jgi:hypothetical protein
MSALTSFLLPLDTTSTMSNVPAFKTSNEFSMHIEQIASEKKMSYLDAVLLFCDQHHLEPSDVASKITKSLKSKIENDFRELNYLPKQAKLDV